MIKLRTSSANIIIHLITAQSICVYSSIIVHKLFTSTHTKEIKFNHLALNLYSLCCIATCRLLTDPDNGVITCSLEDDGVISFGDTCSFKCYSGYELTGSHTRTCQKNSKWSGSETICKRGEKSFGMLFLYRLCA